ncbi:MAG: NUDIX domain-containing protein [Flavobacteriales bacterium]|jgi:8-oxo-dGTP diphosphatase|nr:NUDIX domain-containing protein [Flavobacteriales bacterium]
MNTTSSSPLGPDVRSLTFDVSVDNVVFGFDGEELQVLLIRQGLPGEDMGAERFHMAVPGDLILPEEGLDEAAARILSNLTSIKDIYLKQFHAFGAPDRVFDEKDREWLTKIRRYPNRRVVTVGYYSLVALEDYRPKPSSFASRAEWCPLADIPTLAFDHNSIIKAGLEKLREDVVHNNIIFELLPEKFTLGQFQRLHEIILGKALDKRNFRKNVKRMAEVVPLDEKQAGVLHKPAQLYTYRRQD